jgi:hypothetical protein
MATTTIRHIELPTDIETRIEAIARRNHQTFETALTDLLLKQLNEPPNSAKVTVDNYDEVLERTFGSWADTSEEWFDEMRDSWDERDYSG